MNDFPHPKIMTIREARIARLPKWAQNMIKNLEAERDDLKAQLEIWGVAPSGTSLHAYAIALFESDNEEDPMGRKVPALYQRYRVEPVPEREIRKQWRVRDDHTDKVIWPGGELGTANLYADKLNREHAKAKD